MLHRKIPILFGDSIIDNNNQSGKRKLIGETRLIHVSVIIRHGARTPWSNEIKCWNGFWDSMETGIWNCDDITTFMTAPSRNGTGTSSSDSAFFLFEKRYDALKNALNGTCQMGQLLQHGYDQQIQNGRIIRDAYTYMKGEYDNDERMRLLDISLQDYVPWHPNKLYYRSDDDQRTVMSGQVLLRGLFDPELSLIKENSSNKKYKGDDNSNLEIVIPLHIADRERDILDGNGKDCARLDTIKNKAKKSPAYQAFNESQESKDVRKFMENELGMDSSDASPMDCMMCTICTDRTLPAIIDDYDTTRNNWFTRLIEHEIQQFTIPMKYNNAEWSKLAFGPLWYEIMKNINPHLKDDDDDTIAAPKLALFAGHDTTLMPLLASLGPNLWNNTDWPPYASMLLIEIHELIDGDSDREVFPSKFAFRLIYNGKILTTFVDGCHKHLELCDIKILKSIVDPIATREKDCSRIISPDTNQTVTYSDSVHDSISRRSVEKTSKLVVVVFVLSLFLGSACTILTLRKFQSSTNGNNNNDRKVDYSRAFNIEDNDATSFEMRVGQFRDEAEHEKEEHDIFVNGT